MNEDPAATDVLSARFDLRYLAARGGMGEVWHALERATGRPVAVKLLDDRRAVDPARFEREAGFLATLDDPRIVRYVAHGVDATGRPWLAMEWLQGCDLGALLGGGSFDRRPGEAGLPASLGVATAVALAREIALALATLHERGIVHRDLKPGNVFLVDGDPGRVKLLDFGIAHDVARTRMTQTGALIGTAGYMAPEQARGASVVGPGADVFALGCVLFEALAGEHAYAGDHPMALLTRILFDDPPRLHERCLGVPPALAALLARMLAKDPAERPANGREVAHALEALGPMPDRALERASEPTPAPALTDSERRALAVLLRGPPPKGGEPVVPGWVALEAAAHGASWEPLVDGSVALLVTGGEVATDLATRAALLALALGGRAPDRPIARAMGRARVSSLATGAPVDRAARLLAGRTTPAITVDEVAAGLLEARFALADRDGARVLVGERDVAEVRTLLGRPTPCVGRERELRTLEALHDDAVGPDGGAQVALVTGPPGVGKSRLGRELLAALTAATRARPPLVWAARGEPGRAGSALMLLSGLVQSACGLRGGEPFDARLAHLVTGVEALAPAPERQRLIEFLGELIAAPVDGDKSPRLRAARADGELMTMQIRSAFTDLLAAATATRPVLLVLEDLHWGDLASVQAIDLALGDLEPAPLFVLALARPEIHTRFPGLFASRLVHELKVRELQRPAAHRLCRHVLGPAVDEALIDRLVALSEGNAFYLEELIRAAAEGQADALPESVVAMVQSRLAALPEPERRVLRAGSVFGETFWADAARALVGDAEVVGRALPALVRTELLVARPAGRFPGEAEYTFRHALVREGGYALLTDDDRALGHRLAAEWLAARGEVDALVLAEHFERGGDGQRAAESFLAAAERAGRAGDTRAAIGMVRRGLFAVTAPATREALLGLSCQLHYHRVEALDDARPDAAELLRTAAHGSAPWAQGMLVEITCAVKDGRMEDFARALPPVLQATFEPAAHDPASLTLATICYLLDLGAQLPAANQAFARLEALAATARGHAPAVKALYHLLGALRRPSIDQDPWAGREDARLAHEVAREIGHRKYASVAVLFGALDTWLLGAHDEALTTALGADPAADESGFASATRPFLLAWLHADLGAFDDALTQADRLVATATARAMPLDLARGRWARGEVLRRAGRHPEARAELEAALALARQVVPIDLPGVLASLAHLALAEERPGEALAASREAMGLMAATGTCTPYLREAHLQVAHVEALRLHGDAAAARAVLRLGRERLEAIAGRVADPRYRATFLGGVPENRRLLEMASAAE
ncbi:MAG: protein kinase [Deltaproteobacteria bacterium]|nr:protein kinase [Deltaproteobacteria bacterium]